MSILYLDHSDATLVYAGTSSGVPTILKFGTLSVELSFPFFYPPYFDPREIQINELDVRSAGALITEVQMVSSVVFNQSIAMSGDTYLYISGQKPIEVVLSGAAFLKVHDPEKERTCSEIDHPVPWLLQLAEEASADTLNLLVYLKFENLYLYGPLLHTVITANANAPNLVQFQLRFVAASTEVEE